MLWPLSPSLRPWCSTHQPVQLLLFRARDVIGIGIDISSLSVFWTRNGLYKGVLADTATLLDVVRQALGEGR